MDNKLASTGNVRVWFGGLTSFVNPKSPTAAEINAMMDISDAISWNDFDFGLQTSSTNSDPAITAKSAVSGRGAAQYGGGLSMYYADEEGDVTNFYKQVYDAVRVPGTQGFIVMRVDGKELMTATGTASNPGTDAALGDLVHVFKVESGAWTDSITGEEAFRYTISFLSKGLVAPYTIVRSGAALVVAITPLTLALTSGGFGIVKAKVAGRNYTRGVKWRTSDPAVATVSANGVVTARSVGTANITCEHVASGTASAAPCAVTVSI